MTELIRQREFPLVSGLVNQPSLFGGLDFWFPDQSVRAKLIRRSLELIRRTEFSMVSVGFGPIAEYALSTELIRRGLFVIKSKRSYSAAPCTL